MRKIVKHILFSIVLVVITLHATIPHPHSNELSEIKHFQLHENTHSLIGVIKLAFHESDDENLDNLVFIQYESVKKIDFKHISPAVPVFNNPLSIVETGETVKAVAQNTDNFIKLLFVSPNGLRGPPQLA